MRRALAVLLSLMILVALGIGFARWYATPASHVTLSLYAGHPHNIPPCYSNPCPPIRSRDGDTKTAIFVSVGGIAADPSTGDLYVVDHFASTIRIIRPTGEVRTLTGTPYVAYDSHDVRRCSLRDGAGSEARFCLPIGVAFDQTRQVLYVADYANAAVRRVSLDGKVTTIVGAPPNANPSHESYGCGIVEGTRITAKLCGPTGITVDEKVGDIFVTDSIGMVVTTISQSGGVRILAGKPQSCALRDGRGADASFCEPQGVAFDSRSNSLIVADTSNNRIRRVTLDGRVSTLAGTGYPPHDMDVTDIANAYCRDFDGVGSFAAFCRPFDVAIDSASGEVYVADTSNAEIRRIWHGSTSRVAGHFRWSRGVAWNGGGWCYWSDPPMTIDSICAPTSLAVDPAHRLLYFADNVSGQIWKLAGI